ncbi:hypothetical protein ACQU0X_25940 [Pseudovibrio ascidiaceicola]|uniref:hypothetical protein n=1 Tax=Pseudovibrio ascidiaceicola TaxID=285279 RepID=UPI003D35DD00
MTDLSFIFSTFILLTGLTAAFSFCLAWLKWTKASNLMAAAIDEDKNRPKTVHRAFVKDRHAAYWQYVGMFALAVCLVSSLAYRVLV